jgi:hypothetical protein
LENRRERDNHNRQRRHAPNEFYNGAHVSGGSIWSRLLPEGETPEDQPDEAQEQLSRWIKIADYCT